MISDQALIAAIDNSPLTPEDKQHWKAIIPKLTSDQRERLLHSLTSKTEIRKAINLIERALKIIAQAEAEAEQEVSKEQTQDDEKKELLKELEEIKKQEESILMDEDSLRKQQEQTLQEISKIRQDLQQLSLEAHGSAPPSYQTPPAPSIPQLNKP